MAPMHRLPALLVTGLALTVSSTAQAQSSVYRCTDAQGKVSYQAQPCADAAKGRRVELDTRYVGGQPQARPEPLLDGAAPPPTGPASEVAGAAEPPPPPRPAPPPPLDLATLSKGADVIIVSGNELSSQQTAVHINHPAKPVLLVLSSYHPAQWRVLPGPSTRIKGVIVGSHQQRSAVQAPPDVPVVEDDLPYPTETGNAAFRQLLGRLNSRFGVQTVTAFSGSQRLPGVVSLKGPFPADPMLSMDGVRQEKPRVPMNFDLVTVDGRRVAWTNSGAVDGKRHQGMIRGSGGPQAVTVREDGNEAYALTGNGSDVVWYPQGMGRASTPVAAPKDFPKLSGASGLAWDTRRGILAIVSTGGEGFFYRYDTRNRLWLSARSLKDRDLMGLSFNAATGGYASLSVAGELVFFDEQGQVESVRPLVKILADLESTDERGNGRLEGLTVVAQGKNVAILRLNKGTVTRIWTYEAAAETAQLTYKAPD